ncbi:MAG: hypothetical protein M1454_00550 [Candidatus Thermoplasmatota archaeon]|nr:hypothetical protein [Candidatus Thermoplasmatota archaeon]MCL5730660.1 hypothetical protein [Candidatus Thermoplasmatota archaeon]
MIVEDHRNISCGGDPFNYLKSVLKGLQFSLEDGQEAQILLMQDKFPYEKRLFESVGEVYNLMLLSYLASSGEISVTYRKVPKIDRS